MNTRNSLNDHIHTKCARNLAYIYQFYEKEDEEEVWGSVYNHCHASVRMIASAASVSLCFQLKYAMRQLKMVGTCSNQYSKEMQLFLHLHHSEFEVSIVLGYGATSMSDWCLTF
jgi:hypothetical protein